MKITSNLAPLPISFIVMTVDLCKALDDTGALGPFGHYIVGVIIYFAVWGIIAISQCIVRKL